MTLCRLLFGALKTIPAGVFVAGESSISGGGVVERC